MFWADKFAQEIIKSGQHQPYRVDDMKTPSGQIHVGALRGVVIHNLIHKSLKKAGAKSHYTYVINDMDPMDGFPKYLPSKFKQYMGKPLFQIPSPEPGYQSMAKCYADPFIKVFEQLGCQPKVIWSSELYQKGKFNQVIKMALDNVEIIRKLYQQISGYDKPKNWYPFQVICPQCGKVGTTIVTDWDGKQVSFECKKDLVDWAEGCGYKGKISPFDGIGKLMWKVDWAAHWPVIGITIEGAGKDHMTEGGSHDLSSAICKKAFNYPPPYTFIYEWFLAKGGKKMSSSKGVGVSAVEVSQTLPPEILKFLLVRTNRRQAIIFDPNENETVLDLFDDYDRYAQVYHQQGIKNDYGRIWQLSQVRAAPEQAVFLPRFRDVVNYVQIPSVDIYQKFAEIKGSPLILADKKELDKRIKYAQIWLEKYAPEKNKIGVVTGENKIKLSSKQIKFLRLIIPLLEKTWKNPNDLQQQLYQTAKENKIATKTAFQSIYLSLTGKKYGPKAAWFLLKQDKKMVIDRFKQIANQE